MSLLFFDGFDHYGSSAPVTTKKWSYGLGTAAAIGGGRTGSAMQFYGNYGGNYGCTKILSTPGDVFILGAAFRWNGVDPSDFLYFQEAGIVDHLVFGWTSSGFLTVKRGSTLIATATSLPLSISSWYYLEFKITIHDTTGSVVVRIDGVSPTWDASLTNIDTRNGGTGVVDRFSFAGGYSYYTFVDDLYVCDDAGSMNNNFLGACSVENLMPQTGTGDHLNWTPSTAADHGAMVDEIPPDDDTTYNSSVTVGHQDTYHYPSLALPGTVLGIQTNIYVKKTDVGERTLTPLVRTNSTTYTGTTITPLTTYGYHSQIREVNPFTGVAWTTAEINALQVGVKVVS